MGRKEKKMKSRQKRRLAAIRRRLTRVSGRGDGEEREREEREREMKCRNNNNNNNGEWRGDSRYIKLIAGPLIAFYALFDVQ